MEIQIIIMLQLYKSLAHSIVCFSGDSRQSIDFDDRLSLLIADFKPIESDIPFKTSGDIRFDNTTGTVLELLVNLIRSAYKDVAYGLSGYSRQGITKDAPFFDNLAHVRVVSDCAAYKSSGDSRLNSYYGTFDTLLLDINRDATKEDTNCLSGDSRRSFKNIIPAL
jgi:hypothetical protein